MWDWAVFYPIIHFSKSLLYCLGSDSHMHSWRLSLLIHKQFYGVVSPSSTLFNISPFLFFPGAHLSVSDPRKMGFWLQCCAVHFPQLYPCLRPSSRREEREKQQWGFTMFSWDTALLIRHKGSPPSEFWTPVGPHCWCCCCCCCFRISWSAREQRKGKKNPGRFPQLSLSIKRSFSSPSRQN